MSDPWQPHGQQGWGAGGKPKPHPVVPEPAFYGFSLISLSLLLIYAAKRRKTQRNGLLGQNRKTQQ